jgi:hypothetical protein
LGDNYPPFIALQQEKLCNAPSQLITLRAHAGGCKSGRHGAAEQTCRVAPWLLLQARLTAAELTAKTGCGLA